MTSFWHPTDRAATIGDTLAGGEAGLGEIFSAAIDQMRYVDNFMSRNAALERAITERNEEVYAVTGTRPASPFLTGGGSLDEKLDRWKSEVSQAARRIPDTTVADRLQRSIEGEAIRIARESEFTFEELSASRPGVGGFLAGMGGAMVGAMRDPLVIMSLGLGFGPGAGRTVSSRILAQATREALINGATTAAAQPDVQAWRREAGLDAGMEEALRNVAFATVLGGAFGAAGQGVVEGLTRLSGRALDEAAAAAAARPETPEPVRRAMEGDIGAAREVLPPIREDLPAPARGALDHAEMLEHLETSRPRAASAEHHDVTVSAAHRAVETAERDPDFAFTGFEPDPDQVARVSAEIAGPPPVAETDRPQSLIDFLIDAGGIADDQGELAFLDASRVARPFRGRLVRRDGLKLDAAREAAEEAGYIGQAGEMQVARIPDLLDAIETEMRGQPVFARADQDRVVPMRDWDADLERIEAMAARAASAGGPALDDRLLRAAVELAQSEGIDPADAVERVLTRAELDSPGRSGRTGDVPPGWSDDELMAAAEVRGNPPDAEGGIDRAGDVADDFLISDADIAAAGDLAVPDENGNLVSAARLMEDLKRADDYAALVEACRT